MENPGSKPGIPKDLLSRFKLDARYTAEYTSDYGLQISPATSIRQDVVRVSETRWFRDKEIGCGSFGTVWLEVDQKEGGAASTRAVKELRKSLMQKCGIDYRRELLALAKLSEV